MRVACYIDGFNLYHAIDDLDKPHLKWLEFAPSQDPFAAPAKT